MFNWEFERNRHIIDIHNKCNLSGKTLNCEFDVTVHIEEKHKEKHEQVEINDDWMNDV